MVKQYFDNKHQSDYYVAVNLYDGEGTAVIYGYASRSEIARARVGQFDKTNPVDDYFLFYDDLHPIAQLMVLLRDACRSTG